MAEQAANNRPNAKEAGAYYTPDSVVESLLRWAIRRRDDRLLDPACGDGRFLAGHSNAVGVEQDISSAHIAMKRARWARIYENDFFSWAAETDDRFDCAAGNPPFIRYQTFKGADRVGAIRLCKRLGVDFSGLTSSWAPFLVATAGLLKRGGRMAFVVPAEIGHATYAAPLLDYMTNSFAVVHVVAVREKLFPNLSEDCWLLYADGYGGNASAIRFSRLERFKAMARPPRQFLSISMDEWREKWNRRLRPYLLSAEARELYGEITERTDTLRFAELASISIGYVSGANDFFHLKPSQAERWSIPKEFLKASVRNGRRLPERRLTNAIVERWREDDEAMLLLHLPKTTSLPVSIHRYLDTEEGKAAREGYKCRNRDPWYSVPDVQIPDLFLTYMCGSEPNLVRNDARCTCTNSVHYVRLRSAEAAQALGVWNSEFVKLSCELQGHPLGGGMLKLEPREAGRIALPNSAILNRIDPEPLREAVSVMRSWRHYASASS